MLSFRPAADQAILPARFGAESLPKPPQARLTVAASTAKKTSSGVNAKASATPCRACATRAIRKNATNATTLDIVAKLPDLRPLDAWELSNAAPIEAFAAVLLQVNMKYKTRVAIRFTGLDGKLG